MHPVNGKRPVVELVMLQNGRYQPIKFSNNVQVNKAFLYCVIETLTLFFHSQLLEIYFQVPHQSLYVSYFLHS